MLRQIAFRTNVLIVLGCCCLVSQSTVAASRPQLLEAARNADAKSVRQLLQQQVEINVTEPDGTTPLHWAVYHSQSDIVDLLVRRGANVKAVTRYGVTPLSLAVETGNGAIVEQLLAAGADPNTSLP